MTKNIPIPAGKWRLMAIKNLTNSKNIDFTGYSNEQGDLVGLVLAPGQINSQMMIRFYFKNHEQTPNSSILPDTEVLKNYTYQNQLKISDQKWSDLGFDVDHILLSQLIQFEEQKNQEKWTDQQIVSKLREIVENYGLSYDLLIDERIPRSLEQLKIYSIQKAVHGRVANCNTLTVGIVGPILEKMGLKIVYLEELLCKYSEIQAVNNHVSLLCLDRQTNSWTNIQPTQWLRTNPSTQNTLQNISHRVLNYHNVLAQLTHLSDLQKQNNILKQKKLLYKLLENNDIQLDSKERVDKQTLYQLWLMMNRALYGAIDTNLENDFSLNEMFVIDTELSAIKSDMVELKIMHKQFIKLICLIQNQPESYPDSEQKFILHKMYYDKLVETLELDPEKYQNLLQQIKLIERLK